MLTRKTSSNRLFCFSLFVITLVLTLSPGNRLMARSQRSERAHFVTLRNYFPLATGFRWVYRVQGPGAGRTWEVEVRGEQSAGFFRSYYEVFGYFPMKEPRLVRSTFLGAVVEQGDNGKDYLWYEFGGRVGKSWVMELAPGDSPPCEDGATLTIGARDEVISVPAGEFRHVIRIDYVTHCMDAGITREWFAPGVGLVRREETSIAGPVISELVYAELGDTIIPRSVYSTSLHLSSPRYVHNLMPPVDPSKLARVQGSFVVRNETGGPAELIFPSPCKGLQLEVRDAAGKVVLQAATLSDPCPAVILRVDLAKQPVVVPFSLVLADKDGKPLPDGSYSLTAVLLTSVPDETLRPAARAQIQISSTH